MVFFEISPGRQAARTVRRRLCRRMRDYALMLGATGGLAIASLLLATPTADAQTSAAAAASPGPNVSSDVNMRVGVPGIAVVSGSDSRSLSPQAITGACIVGVGVLGDAQTHSTSDPTGTTSSSQARGVLPTTITEATFAGPPDTGRPVPPAGAALGAATAPLGRTDSSSTVTRDTADSQAHGPISTAQHLHN